MVDLKSFLPEVEQVASGKTKGAIGSRRGKLGVNVLDVSGCCGIKVGDLCGRGPNTKLRNRIDDRFGADRGGERTLQLRAGWYARTGEGGVVDHAAPFLGVKEESISETGNADRAAEGKAKIVVAQRGTAESLEVIEEVVGGEKVVAEKFVSAAMEGISSRTGDYVDLSAGAATEFGIVV